jgi:5'-nucleotidase
MISNRIFSRRIALASAAILTLLLALGLATPEFRRAAAQEQSCPVRVTLLQVNDVYQFAPTNGGTRGGLARVLTLRKQIMSESPHTLFMMAGDTLSPSIESNTYKGKQMIEAWDASGLDYATFGNHEFDFGPDVLRDRMRESHFQWLAANVIDKKTGQAFGGMPEFSVREFEGIKIGIFGILLPDTIKTSRPGPDVDIQDPCATAARVVPKIRAAGAQVIVALTHLSMREDKQLAICSGVDLIVGGHEHTLLESLAGHAPIFKMTSDARELGRIDLNISKTTGRIESIDWQVIPVTDKIKDDPAFEPLNQKYGPLMKSLEQTIGRTAVELDLKSEDVRTQETNMGDFIADAFRQATGSDVALVNGGSVRADTLIAPGVLTKRDILSALPYNNHVVKLQVTGAIVRAALEHGVASFGLEIQPARFPQVSGMRYTFDASLPAGKRITSIAVNGKPLDDQHAYTLATTNYVAIDAGDGYEMFRQAPLLIRPEQGQVEVDILLKAIAAVPAIAPKTDGRIKRLDTARSPASCN